MLGSLLCDKFICYGRIKTAYFANILIMVSVVPQMWLTVPSLCIGRFLLGFGGGLCIVTSSVFMAETVPAWKLGTVGTAVNSGIIFGLLVTAIIQGLTLPSPNITDMNLIATTQSWRYGFAAPGVFAFFNIIFWALFIRQDSITYLIDK